MEEMIKCMREISGFVSRSRVIDYLNGANWVKSLEKRSVIQH
jgi:hypothetical protein